MSITNNMSNFNNISSMNKQTNFVRLTSPKNDLSTKSLYLQSTPNLNNNLTLTNGFKSIPPSPSYNKSRFSNSPHINNNKICITNTNQGNQTHVKIIKKSQTANKAFKLSGFKPGIEIQNRNAKYKYYEKAKFSTKSNDYIKTFSYNSYQGTVRYIIK